jgi:hypothetical protein
MHRQLAFRQPFLQQDHRAAWHAAVAPGVPAAGAVCCIRLPPCSWLNERPWRAAAWCDGGGGHAWGGLGRGLTYRADALCTFEQKGNLLTELPASLGECAALTELDASSNRLEALPRELADCSKLKKLCCTDNPLSGDPKLRKMLGDKKPPKPKDVLKCVLITCVAAPGRLGTRLPGVC